MGIRSYMSSARKAALKKAQAAAAKARRLKGKLEARGGRLGRLVVAIGGSQRTTGKGGRGGGRGATKFARRAGAMSAGKGGTRSSARGATAARALTKPRSSSSRGGARGTLAMAAGVARSAVRKYGGKFKTAYRVQKSKAALLAARNPKKKKRK